MLQRKDAKPQRFLIGALVSVGLISCGGSGSAPTTPTVIQIPVFVPTPVVSPPVAKLVIQIDKSGSTAAIAGYTPVVFDGSASQGEQLTYFFDFGDGESMTTSHTSVTHVCRAEGFFTVKLTVRDNLDRASTVFAKLPCLTLLNTATNAFTNNLDNTSSRRYEFRRLRFVSQTGAALRGYYTHPESYTSSFTGTLSGDRSLTIRLDDGTITFAGEVRFNANYTDTSWSKEQRLVLVMTGGSANGQTLTFNYYDPY